MNKVPLHVPACVRRSCPSHHVPARVSRANRDYYSLLTEHGETYAELSGSLRYSARRSSELPVVGDWVYVDGGLIRGVCPRWSRFSRRAAGSRTEEQVLVANIDVVFVVTGLDGDFNLRRLERYLVLATESLAEPVIVLSKADLCPGELADKITAAKSVAEGVPILCTSTVTHEGLEGFDLMLQPGQTGVLLGSSGAGKSSISNHLIGEELHRVAAVRDHDSRGRHTTTASELLELPGGAFLIDTPGLRELQLWADEESVEDTFRDISALASKCRFNDCQHITEPGCAVRDAIASGDLNDARWSNYRKITSEVHKLDQKAIRRIHREMRVNYRERGKF